MLISFTHLEGTISKPTSSLWISTLCRPGIWGIFTSALRACSSRISGSGEMKWNSKWNCSMKKCMSSTTIAILTIVWKPTSLGGWKPTKLPSPKVLSLKGAAVTRRKDKIQQHLLFAVRVLPKVFCLRTKRYLK